MTNWVTIKVPEEARDKAREDPRTYGEILEAGCETATSTETEQTPERIAQEVANALDMAAFNGALSDEQANELIGRLDDLEAQLPRKVAEEVHSR